MADQKLTDLSAVVTPVDADLIYTVTDVGTTPTSKKGTWTVIKAFLKTYFDTLYQVAGSYLTSSNIEDSIVDGHTTVAPSGNAVFDALALKAPLTSPTFATSINGSYLTASQILGTDGSKNIISLPVATYPNLTELSYVKGVTSAIQTQLGGKQATLGFTPENVANKVTSFQATPDDTHYASEKLVKDSLDGKQATGSYEVSTNKENTTLDTSTTKYPTNRLTKEYADTKLAKATNITAINDTGIADGEIMVANLTNKDIRTSDKTIVTTLGADDTTVPTSKAVKDVTDAKAPLASPTFTGTVTLPKTTEIQDTSADHQYVLAVNELTADRTVTLPLLTGNDEFVFKDHAQTLTNKTLGTTQLGEVSLKLDETLSADEKWSGITTKGTAGATLAVGDVCYLASSGKWLLNDGILDGTDTGFSKQLGICVLAGADTKATEMLLYGKIRSAAFPTFTKGSPLYLDDTAGDMTATKPSTTNFAVRVLGFALSAEDLMFNPSNDFAVVK